MKNKKGFIRIIEAIFAILVIMSAALILVSNSVQTSDISEEVHEKQRYILEVIANNEAMREQILAHRSATDPTPNTNPDISLVKDFTSKNSK